MDANTQEFVIFHVGSSFTKVALCPSAVNTTDSMQIHRIPTLKATYKPLNQRLRGMYEPALDGYDVLNQYLRGAYYLHYKSPSPSSLVNNFNPYGIWEHWEYFMQGIYANILKRSSDGHPIIYIEAAFQPRIMRELLVTSLFEGGSIPKVCILSEPVLCLLSSVNNYDYENVSGLSVKIGGRSTTITPVFNGEILHTSGVVIPRGSKNFNLKIFNFTLESEQIGLFSGKEKSEVSELKKSEELNPVSLDALINSCLENEPLGPNKLLKQFFNKYDDIHLALYFQQKRSEHIEEFIDDLQLVESILKCISSIDDIRIIEKVLSNVILYGGGSQFISAGTIHHSLAEILEKRLIREKVVSANNNIRIISPDRPDRLCVENARLYFHRKGTSFPWFIREVYDDIGPELSFWDLAIPEKVI